MARFHIFKEKEMNLRFEIPEGQIHGGYPTHRFKGTSGNRSSTLETFHAEESGVES
jgi:hypothetical protein